jgi:hypothetical protein
MSGKLTKRRRTTRVLLERASEAIPASGITQTSVAELRRRALEHVESDELELALDRLEELGELAACRGGFWRDLERAAAMMELDHRAQRLHRRFLSAAPHR